VAAPLRGMSRAASRQGPESSARQGLDLQPGELDQGIQRLPGPVPTPRLLAVLRDADNHACAVAVDASLKSQLATRGEDREVQKLELALPTSLRGYMGRAAAYAGTIVAPVDETRSRTARAQGVS